MLLVALSLLLPKAQDALPAYAVARLSGFTRPGLPAVTGHICVDQFGYEPAEAKVAVISDPQKGYNSTDHYQPGASLEVRTKAGKTVVIGSPKAWKNGATHEDSGDRGWWFDFSSLSIPGEYYVYDPSTKLRSPLFRIDTKVYRPVLQAATRVFFYQRLAEPILAAHAKGPWVDKPAYLQDKRARYVLAKDDPKQERDLSGGWMDAGDTDKYPPFNGEVIHPLLYAYRANPSIFGDADGIPESGNKLPDLLDEVKVQMDWLARMQFADGSVPVKMGNIDYNGKYPLWQDPRTRYYGPKDSGATIFSCSFFAHAARVYAKFTPWMRYAKEMRARAERAWAWYHSNPRTFNTDTGEIKSGIANRSAEEQDRMEAYAAIHLFALTGDEKYQAVINEKAVKARQLSEYVWSPYEAGASEALVDYVKLPKADPALVTKIRDQLNRSANSDQFAPAPDADLYRAWMQGYNYHWGSNIVRASWGVVALLAADQGGVDEATKIRLRQRASDMLHSFHGVNPFNVVYLTNMNKVGAENSLTAIYHERYGVGTPFEKNPPPGYVVGGANSSYSGNSGDGKPSVAWLKNQPRSKTYADFCAGWPESSWELSEPAIYYQAMYVRLVAGLAK